MAQPPKTAGYAPVLPGNTTFGMDQERLDQFKLDLEDSAGRKRRQQALDEYLSQYDDDPLTRTFATIEFEAQEAEKQKESQKLAREKERKSIINKYPDDPIMQAIALEENDVEKTRNLPQKEAFSRRERLEQIDERDQTARKLDRFGLGNAFVRESLGSAVNVVPSLAAVPARAAEAVGMVESGTTNELNRQAGAFQDAREQARQDDMSPWLSRMYGGASQSFLQMAATPGGATSKIVGAGVMSGNEALTTAEDAGLTGTDRLRFALTQGGLEAVIALAGQKLFGGGIESRMAGQAVAAQTWKQLAKNVGADALKEMPEEVITSILQDVSSKLEGVSPDMQLEDFIAHATDAAVQSVMMAGMANAPNAARMAMPGRKPIQPEIEAFTQNPSRKKYEAAVKAGLPPIEDAKSSEGRAKYAADLQAELQSQAEVQVQPELQNEASSVEMPPMETPSGMVPDSELDEMFNVFEGSSNGQEANVTEDQPNITNDRASEEKRQEGEQGRQEGLLTVPEPGTETPSGTEGMEAAASPNDSTVSAASTREDFEKEYRDTFREWMKYPPDQAGHTVYRDKMADLYDAHPDWADEIENTLPKPEPQAEPTPAQPMPPELASGETSPVQSAPSLAEPVSKPQEATPVATGVPSPDQSSKEAGPVSETPRRGMIGDMLTTGEVVQTASGRPTTPFPKIALDTKRKLSMTLRKAEEWLQSNALAEAESRGDEFNALQFRNEKPGKMPKATKDAMEEYLFGEQPAVVPSILKPMVTPEKPKYPEKGPVIEDWYGPDKARVIEWTKTVNPVASLKPKEYAAVYRNGERIAAGLVQMTLKNGVDIVSDGRTQRFWYGKDGNQFAVGIAKQRKEESPESKPAETPAEPSGRDRILAAVKQVNPRVQSGDMVSIADLREAVGMEPAEFDQTMQQLVKDKVLAAHRFDRPNMVSDEQRQKMLKLGDSWHNTVSLWENEPGDRDRINQMMDDAESKKPEAPVEQPSQEDLMEQILREELLGEKPKKERKPRTPKTDTGEPKAPRKPRTEAAKKRTERTAAELKAAEDDIRKAFGSTANMGLNPEQMRATARLVKAALNHQVSTFNEFVAYVVDTFGEPLALKMADGIELAWRTLKRLPEYSGIDEAGKVADVINQKEKAKDESTTAPDEGMGGMPGESGGTLAPETGSTTEDGETEAGTGPDDNDVPDGTDGATETESAGTGTVSEGTGAESDIGTKPKPGRKPSVRGSRKPTVRVPKQVGAPRNLRIQPDDTIAPNGVVSKLKANIAAIKLLKELQSENRQATEAEQRVLMQYTGWGSLQHVFDENKGKAFVERPGLPEQYGEWYSKSQLYQKAGQYIPLEELRKRVETWEKQWGESYRFLKENLTPEEWKKAKASVLNAHFTSRDVITNGIWGALEQMGVTGGRFMEPSSGIGSLIGLMPEAIANDSEVIAIELDSLTGEMVKQLYPDADVHVKGFEEVPIPAGTIDVAATNVPFHKIGPADAKSRYGREMNLHNYFIARMLDSLRPGGLAAVISTHFTMDANPEDRALLASKADLVGAIRLPNSAFKANAGTEVTTDIMFFRKPDGSPFKGESWQNLASVGTYTFQKQKTKKGPLVDQEGNITVNEYFAAHPEMVLGTHSMEGKQYSDTEYTVMPAAGSSLAEQLQKAVKNLPAGIATTDNAPLMPSMDTGTTGVEGRIEFRGGKLQELSKGEWIAPVWLKDAMLLTKKGEPRKLKDETKNQKIADAMRQGIAYTKVRNAYEVHLANMRNEDTTQAEYEASQKALNDAYDAYRQKHGTLNHSDSEWLERDPGFFFVSGLEVESEIIDKGQLVKTYVKADVFRQRTVNPDSAPKSADTTEDAVKMSLAWRGAINLPWMSELTGTSEEDLEAELLESGTVFLNPETSLLEPADTYLSGNVQAKLRAAEKAVAEGDNRFERNVELLKSVQPPKMTIDSITPSLGQEWVPREVVHRWLAEVIKLPNAEVYYNAKADIWSIDTGGIPRDIQNDWGTLGMHLSDLLPKVLNGSTIRVMKKEARTDADGRVRDVDVVDDAQTQAAQVKAEKLRDSFERWAKSDENAIPLIEQAFNEQKNFYVKPQYNGEHLTFPGMSELWMKRMRPYQKNTIWRAIREGRGMIAHGVGAGKTAELIAIAMEMKRLGTATKPLIVVQNSTLGQFARTFTEVYPAAKVLVASKDDLNPENRAKFMARIATGNWDAIVMAKSTFNMKLPNDPALEKAMVDGLIAELESIMLEASLAEGKGSPSVKAIQQQINSLVKRLDGILTRINERTDNDVYFEQMGVDALFLDEAHDYKKPPFVTKLDRSIKGLSTDVSGRALSALIKMRFIQTNNRGRNTFMATGTPITNTLGESWLLMNMVAPDVLKEFGVETFDQFVATFARVVSSLETNAVGKLDRKTRLAKFKNGHQLSQFIQSGWDVLLGDDLHSKIREYGGGKVPKMENGKETLHMVDRSPAFDAFGKFFIDLYDAYKRLEGEDKRTYSWIPVTIYGAAKAAAIDVRLVDPTAPDDPGSKLNRMIDGVYENYVDGTNVSLQVGEETLTGQNLTQLIFSDTSGRTNIDNLRSFAAGEGVTIEINEDDDSDSDSEDDTTEDAPATGKKKKKDRWLYQEIKRKLIEKGVPEEQVQIINDHNSTPEKLLAFQDRVSSGEVRIVIGHSDTLGTGVNVQPRLKDIWELDIPMVPAKREQRLGRMIRSGNMNEIVRAHVMAMQRSLDGTLMAMNLRKAKAAEQALSGKLGAEFEDPYSESLMSMADMEAAMNDDPLFYRQRELEFQIRQRRLEMEALDQQRSRERSRIRSNEMTIERTTEEVAKNIDIANKVEKALAAGHPFVIGDKTIPSQKEAEKALKKTYDSESDRISKETQDSKIKALSNYYMPEAEHVAAKVKFGPIQFNVIYGERPEVVQDDKGNPTTKWTSATGTVITLDGKKIEETRATTLSTVMEFLKDSVPDTRKFVTNKQKTIDDLTVENVKLEEFLAKPFDAQIELDNLESQLAQVNDLMFQRDNPAPKPATPEATPERQAADKARQELQEIQSLNSQHDKVILKEWQRVIRGQAPGSGLPITDEMARAIVGRMIGSVRAGVKQFEVFIRELRASHPEELVRSIKPNLIRTWNALKDKYDLDDAMDVAFEAAVTDTKDVDIEQAIEAAKGETPEEMPKEPAGERLYSTKNAFSAVTREELGMGERPPVPTLEREPSIEMAKAYGQTKSGSDYIDTLIQELTAQPRAVTPYENDLLNYRNAELGEKLDTALRSQIAARKSGDSVQEAIAQTQAGNLRKAKQALIELVLEPIGTEAGRALQARKAVINQDFTLERLAMEYEAAYGKELKGQPLEDMQKLVDDLKAGNAELQKLLDEAKAKIDDLETRLKEAHDAAVAAEKTPAPPAPVTDTQSEARKENLRKRREDAHKRLGEFLSGNTAWSIGGVVGEAGSVFTELALVYSEMGVVTLSDFLSRVRKRHGPQMDRVIEPLTEAWKQVTAQFTGNELDAITSRIDILDPDTIGKAARNLHSFVIRRDGLDASAAGREAAVDAVHQILADFVPGITPEEVARAMSGIGIYSELSKDEAEIVRRDQKAQLLSLQQIADWKKGQAPPATGMERPPISDEQRALRRAVNEAKKAAGIVEATAGQLRSALDAAKRMARNRIADLDKALTENTPIPGNKKILKDDGSPAFAELTALRARRDKLQKQYDEAFGKRELSDEQRLNMAEKALDRAIADLESDLKAGKLYPDAPGPQVTSPAIEAKREILDALKASRDELRLQSGEAQARSDAAYERMLMERGARLAQKIADQDFAPPEKKPERELTPAMLKQMLANQKMQQKIQSERRKWEFDNKHIVYKAMTWGPVATAAIIRKGLTTFDQSLIGRQGFLLGITHPEIYGKAIRQAFASNPLKAKSIFPTEQDLFNTQAALDADANWVRLEKIAKLAVTDVHGGLNREEENQFVPEWVNKIPGAGGSERAGSAFINTQRRLVFRSLVDKLSKTMDGKNKTISNADLRVIGNLVNVASGRGNIGNWSAAIKGMSSVFFSPSWWASRLAWWAGQPVWQDARWTGGEGASTEVRMMAAMEWGKQIAAQAAIIGLVSAGLAAAFGPPGDDEEWDFYVNPISPNFGKIRVGNTMIDMTAGLGQHLSYFARILTGKQSDRWEMNEISRIRLALTYGRGKLAPIPASVVDFLVGSDMHENKVGTGEWVKGKVLPLMVQDVMNASQKEGLPMAPIISGLMFFGIGAQSYDERIKERTETVNEVRALQKQGKPQSEIDALLNKHFASQAAKEAKEALRTAEPEEAAKLETIVAETESPELTEAIQKEKGDLVLVASVMLSTEDKTKDKKSPDEDKSITTARDLLKAVAPTYEDADKLYTEAYKHYNDSITELVGPKGKKRYVVKKNVVAARRRLKAMYEK